MTNHWIILFVAIPLATGVLNISLAGRPRLQRTLGTLSLLAMLALAVTLLVQITQAGGAVLVSQMGDWPAPFGITVVFDSLSGLLLAAASTVSLGCYVHSFSILDENTERRYFHPLMQFLMFGVNLSFLTGDLFNLFVSFEIMLMSSYALLSIGATRKQMTQAYKYVLLNLVASTVFVISAGLVYGMMGTLNMADLSRIVMEKHQAGEALPVGFKALSVMLLLVFGLKGAFFPLWFWLPDTYYTCPISVAGLFGGLLTKVGVYAVLRTFPMIFAYGGPINPDNLNAVAGPADIITPIVAISAAFTMFLGVLGAVSQHEVRRILSVHVISQVGYMVFGIAVGVGLASKDPALAAAGMAGCLFYMIQHMIVKSSLFLCCGVMEKHAGSDDLNKIGGLLKKDVLLAVMFFIAAMSLVGLPPLSGFFGKLVIIQAGWENYPWLSALGLATGALTLLSMLKIWSYGYWYPPKGQWVAQPAQASRSSMRSAYLGIAFLVITALGLGFGAAPVYTIAENAGKQLNDPKKYVAAVLGEDYRPSIPPPKYVQAERVSDSLLETETARP